ncbi:MAG: hypothetical protein ACE5K8_00520 [Candidatus Zixiibacteriota bacterium]
MFLSGKRLLVASNRLPVAIVNDDGQWKVEPGTGGLITALAPVMRRSRGIWIGWPGCGPEAPAESLLEEYSIQQEFDLKPVI